MIESMSTEGDSAHDFPELYASQATESETSPDPKEGFRLVQAFDKIKSPARRRAVLTYVEDLTKLDEADGQ